MMSWQYKEPGHQETWYWSSLSTTIGVNSLWPSTCTTIWRDKSCSTLDQVMACCLTAPSHYLHQCWFIISEVFQHSPEGNFTGNTFDMSLKITNLRLQPHLPGVNELTLTWPWPSLTCCSEMFAPTIIWSTASSSSREILSSPSKSYILKATENEIHLYKLKELPVDNQMLLP